MKEENFSVKLEGEEIVIRDKEGALYHTVAIDDLLDVEEPRMWSIRELRELIMSLIPFTQV